MKLYVASDGEKAVTLRSIEAGVDRDGGFANLFVDGGHIELSRAECERLIRELQEINW